MVNTVGSCKTKHWTRKWKCVKGYLELTQEQRTLIVGSLLGDGTMRVGEEARNANFKVEHGLLQREYVLWKYRILRPFVFTEPRISFRYRQDETRERYPKSWWFRTIRHPHITEIYHRFYTTDGYRTGRKVVPRDIKNDINPYVLAVWIMDDGSFNKGTIDISTYSFQRYEVEILCRALKNMYDIEMKFYRDRDKGYRMLANQKETQKIVHIIHPYIIPSLMYKIGFTTP